MEALRLALEAVAEHDPAWLKAHVPGDWLQYYGPWTQAEPSVSELPVLYLLIVPA